MALLTLEEAKRQLRIEVDSTSEFDEELTQAVEEASDIVLDYLKYSESPEWDEETVPWRIKRAAKLILTNIWEHRGDSEAADPLSQAVKDILARDRDPTLA